MGRNHGPSSERSGEDAAATDTSQLQGHAGKGAAAIAEGELQVHIVFPDALGFVCICFLCLFGNGKGATATYTGHLQVNAGKGAATFAVSKLIAHDPRGN